MHPILSEAYVQALVDERRRAAAIARRTSPAAARPRVAARAGRALIRAGERLSGAAALPASSAGC